MILTGHEIMREVDNGRIWISPFDPQRVQPNSYDFRLGNALRRYTSDVLDVRVDNPCEQFEITNAGYVLQPDRLYLGHTAETMGSDTYVPIIRGRSSIARLGLFIHVTADLIDIGSRNQWTLQLHAVQPVRIYPSMLIGQVTFWCVQGQIALYQGKYQSSMGPWSSRSYLDYVKGACDGTE
jgi:dCTP deaminase